MCIQVYKCLQKWGITDNIYDDTDAADGDECDEYCWAGDINGSVVLWSYLIFVIFSTRARFVKPKFYTQKRVN